jgi:hypothetical protein
MGNGTKLTPDEWEALLDEWDRTYSHGDEKSTIDRMMARRWRVKQDTVRKKRNKRIKNSGI